MEILADVKNINLNMEEFKLHDKPDKDNKELPHCQVNTQKGIFCDNCGKYGHTMKKCSDPITSLGIILINIQVSTLFILDKMFSKTDKHKKKHKTRVYSDPIMSESSKQINSETITKRIPKTDSPINKSEELENVIKKRNYLKRNLIHSFFKSKNSIINDNYIKYKDEESALALFTYLKDKIKFLLISRKNELGYMEFIRGHYNVDDGDGIINLFQQMTSDEIKMIEANKNNFDNLWQDIWKNDKHGKRYEREYQSSKEKFIQLAGGNLGDNGVPLVNPKLQQLKIPYDIDFYIQNVSPKWNIPEWGFPKGRRTHQEKDVDCANREFQEESNFKYNEYVVLKNIQSLEEDFLGTNNIRYRHKYFLGISKTDKIPSIDQNNVLQTNEIGKIGWFSYDEVMKILRPYHTERRRLITQVFMFIVNHILDLLKN